MDNIWIDIVRNERIEFDFYGGDFSHYLVAQPNTLENSEYSKEIFKPFFF